jgi:hypothetical protein
MPGTSEQDAWVARVLGVRLGARAPAAGRTETADAKTPGGAAVRVAKGLLLWNATRSRLEQQLKQLQQAILDQSKDEADYDDIKANVGAVEVVLERLDDRLSAKLDQLKATTDAGEKVRLSEEARQVVTDYQGYVASDPLMQDLDDNGFIPMDSKAKIEAALAAILTTI